MVEREGMHHHDLEQRQNSHSVALLSTPTSTPPPPAPRTRSSAMAPPPMLTAHLNLSIPLHVQVPPLPSPNTTAAATALFRVNQLPSSSVSLLSPTVVDGLSFRKLTPSSSPTFHHQQQQQYHHHHQQNNQQNQQQQKKATKRQRMENTNAIMALYPSGAPTPTTAAAAAAAMMLSSSAPASAASFVAAQHAYDDHNNQNEQSQNQLEEHDYHEENEEEDDGATPTGEDGDDGATTPKSGHGAAAAELRRRKVGIPKFLRYLFQMLEFEDHAIIAWSHDGTAFQIKNPEQLADRVLPKYFKHNKVSSFQRQLNYFGFKKWTKTQTNICTFSHPSFIRDDQEKMRQIKRKERSTRGLLMDEPGGGGPSPVSYQQQGAEEVGASDDYPIVKMPPTKRAKMVQGMDKQRGGGDGKRLKKPAKAKPPRGKNRKNTSTGMDQEDSVAVVRHEPEREPSARPRKLTKQQQQQQQQLPTISHAESSSSSSTLNRLATSESPSSCGNQHQVTTQEMLFHRGPGSGTDAAPVLPIHANMLLHHQQQQQQQQQNNGGYMRRSGGGGGGYDNQQELGSSLHDASPTSHTHWPSPHHTTNNSNNSHTMDPSSSSSYALASFKFPEPAAFDLEPSPSPHGSYGSGGGSSNTTGITTSRDVLANGKDYLDVLLESANMDDQISSVHGSTGTSTGGMAAPWDTAAAAAFHHLHHQQQQQQQQHQQQQQLFGQYHAQSNDRRLMSEAAMATFNMLSSPSQPQPQAGAMTNLQQLPSIEDLQGGGGTRY